MEKPANSKAQSKTALAKKVARDLKVQGQEKVLKALPKALDVIIGLLTSPDPIRRIEAAKYIVDQAIGRPKQQLDVAVDPEAAVATAAAMFEMLKQARNQMAVEELPIHGHMTKEGTYNITNAEYTIDDEDDPTDRDGTFEGVSSVR